MEKLNGQCLCGEIKFYVETPTDFCSHCHCQSCRRSHGSAFVTWASVLKEKFHLTSGENNLKWYRSSEWIEWGFCNHCGSSMFYRAIKEGHPESPKASRMYFTAANLSELDRKPSVHVSYEEKVDWLQLHDSLPKHRGKTDERMDVGQPG